MSQPDGTLMCGTKLRFKGIAMRATGLGEIRETRETVESTHTESPVDANGQINAEYLASCIVRRQPIRIPVIFSAAHKDLWDQAFVGTGTLEIDLPAEFGYEAVTWEFTSHMTERMFASASGLEQMLAGEFVFQPTGLSVREGGDVVAPDPA